VKSETVQLVLETAVEGGFERARGRRIERVRSGLDSILMNN